MKRIALLVCGSLLLIASTAEARRSRWTTNSTYYTQPAQAAPANNTSVAPAAAQDAAVHPAAAHTAATQNAVVQTVAVQPAAQQTTGVQARTAAFDTRTAQGVANIMASYNQVGHWGGNPGYEGCGCGATQAAAYSICCYANSGMTTVDVGYAQSASGMWYCCRRYR